MNQIICQKDLNRNSAEKFDEVRGNLKQILHCLQVTEASMFYRPEIQRHHYVYVQLGKSICLRQPIVQYRIFIRLHNFYCQHTLFWEAIIYLVVILQLYFLYRYLQTHIHISRCFTRHINGIETVCKLRRPVLRISVAQRFKSFSV